MDSLRRTLVLGLPVVAMGGLHGCGGAENDPSAKATPQALGRTSAQAEATTAATDTTPGFSIQNRSGGNFPVVGTRFDLLPQASQIQAVLNPGSPGGIGPVLALQVATARPTTGATLVAELAVSIKLGRTIPSGSAIYDLAPGGAQASDGLVTCRQIGQDGSTQTCAFRIAAGTLVLHRLDSINGTVTVSLSDVVAYVAPGFANKATGSVAVSTNNPTSLLLATENTGTQLS